MFKNILSSDFAYCIWKTYPLFRKHLEKSEYKMFPDHPELFLSKFYHSENQVSVGLFGKIGFCKSQKIGEINYTYNKNGGYIQNIGIRNPEYRNKGLGNILLQEALKDIDSNNVQTVKLVVANYNKEALHLYNKNNFVVHEIIEKGYELIRRKN